jgi:Bleomycin resistance protein-like N-terminal
MNAASDTNGKVVWFEIPAEEAERARSFYGDLFGWSFQPFEGPNEYHLTTREAALSTRPTGRPASSSTSARTTSMHNSHASGSSGEPHPTSWMCRASANTQNASTPTAIASGSTRTQQRKQPAAIKHS